MRFDFKRIIALTFLCVAYCAAQNAIPFNPAPVAGQVPMFTANTAADTATLVAGQVSSSLLVGTPTAGATYTTPTATVWCSLAPFLANQGAANWWYNFFVKNTSAGANTITMGAGSGVTISGTATIAQNAVRHFIVILSCSGTPAVTMLSVGSSAF